MKHFSVKGKLVDIEKHTIYPAEIFIKDGKIETINKLDVPDDDIQLPFILPGFVDAHVHIESSMLIPSEFARLAVVHGTVATVSDPHEIANVCGIEGVEFMIENGKTVPFKFNFGAPSCVPATIFETAGARLDSKAVEALLMRDEIKYLSEMMNFPGVLQGDKEVLSKIRAAHRLNKLVDGHAPGLRGDQAKQYISEGISTDHECFTIEEALDKLKHGMKIIIREGSAAKNFEALIDLLHDYPDHVMFCSDDKHPDSLVEGHINQLCERAVQKGVNIFHILKAACLNPVNHYNLEVGLLKEGDAADFILVNDLKSFTVRQVYIDGILVAENGKSLIEKTVEPGNFVNNFNCSNKTIEAFHYRVDSIIAEEEENRNRVHIIEALDGQLITNKIEITHDFDSDLLQPNVEEDILKIVVVNRYTDTPIAKAFIKNFGLKKGAIASSVAHDSHNIVAVGVDDASICRAVNLVIEHKGAVSLTAGYSDNHESPEEMVIPLPVAGLMSREDGYEVARKYSEIDAAAKQLGSTLSAPFMTLSFMALLVIPHLKISDKGLFDAGSFSLVNKAH